MCVGCIESGTLELIDFTEGSFFSHRAAPHPQARASSLRRTRIPKERKRKKEEIGPP